MPTVTFTIDAEVANRRFTVDAWITGNRLRHDRTLDHTGVQTTETVVLSADIGPYPAGTTVQAVLEDFVIRIAALEGVNKVFRSFAVDAFILPHFWVNAVIRRTPTGSFTTDAVIAATGHSFTVNAVIFRPGSGSARSFTIDAFLV